MRFNQFLPIDFGKTCPLQRFWLKDLAIYSAEAAGFKHLSLEHKIRRHVDNGMVRGVMILLELRRHPLGCRCGVGHRLKHQFHKFDFGTLQLLGDLAQKSRAC